MLYNNLLYHIISCKNVETELSWCEKVFQCWNYFAPVMLVVTKRNLYVENFCFYWTRFHQEIWSSIMQYSPFYHSKKHLTVSQRLHKTHCNGNYLFNTWGVYFQNVKKTIFEPENLSDVSCSIFIISNLSMKDLAALVILVAAL